jgi:hypothetical protein
MSIKPNIESLVREAKRTAQYFIDRGNDAHDNEIKYPKLYMAKAIANARAGHYVKKKLILKEK